MTNPSLIEDLEKLLRDLVESSKAERVKWDVRGKKMVEMMRQAPKLVESGEKTEEEIIEATRRIVKKWEEEDEGI